MRHRRTMHLARSTIFSFFVIMRCLCFFYSLGPASSSRHRRAGCNRLSGQRNRIFEADDLHSCQTAIFRPNWQTCKHVLISCFETFIDPKSETFFFFVTGFHYYFVFWMKQNEFKNPWDNLPILGGQHRRFHSKSCLLPPRIPGFSLLFCMFDNDLAWIKWKSALFLTFS